MEWIKGGRLLHTAAEFGGFGMVKVLIERAGLDINQKNKEGWTLLVIALKHGRLSVAKLFIENEEPVLNQVTPGEEDTPLHLAAKAGNAELVKLLRERGLSP